MTRVRSTLIRQNLDALRRDGRLYYSANGSRPVRRLARAFARGVRSDFSRSAVRDEPDDSVCERVAPSMRRRRPAGGGARAADERAGRDRRAAADAHADGGRQRASLLPGDAERARDARRHELREPIAGTRTAGDVPGLVRSADQGHVDLVAPRGAAVRSRRRRDSGQRAEDAAPAAGRAAWSWRARSLRRSAGVRGGDLRRPARGLCARVAAPAAIVRGLRSAADSTTSGR